MNLHIDEGYDIKTDMSYVRLSIGSRLSILLNDNMTLAEIAIAFSELCDDIREELDARTNSNTA